MWAQAFQSNVALWWLKQNEKLVNMKIELWSFNIDNQFILEKGKHHVGPQHAFNHVNFFTLF